MAQQGYTSYYPQSQSSHGQPYTQSGHPQSHAPNGQPQRHPSSASQQNAQIGFAQPGQVFQYAPKQSQPPPPQQPQQRQAQPVPHGFQPRSSFGQPQPPLQPQQPQQQWHPNQQPLQQQPQRGFSQPPPQPQYAQQPPAQAPYRPPPSPQLHHGHSQSYSHQPPRPPPSPQPQHPHHGHSQSYSYQPPHQPERPPPSPGPILRGRPESMPPSFPPPAPSAAYRVPSQGFYNQANPNGSGSRPGSTNTSPVRASPIAAAGSYFPPPVHRAPSPAAAAFSPGPSPIARSPGGRPLPTPTPGLAQPSLVREPGQGQSPRKAMPASSFGPFPPSSQLGAQAPARSNTLGGPPSPSSSFGASPVAAHTYNQTTSNSFNAPPSISSGTPTAKPPFRPTSSFPAPQSQFVQPQPPSPPKPAAVPSIPQRSVSPFKAAQANFQVKQEEVEDDRWLLGNGLRRSASPVKIPPAFQQTPLESSADLQRAGSLEKHSLPTVQQTGKFVPLWKRGMSTPSPSPIHTSQIQSGSPAREDDDNTPKRRPLPASPAGAPDLSRFKGSMPTPTRSQTLPTSSFPVPQTSATPNQAHRSTTPLSVVSDPPPSDDEDEGIADARTASEGRTPSPAYGIRDLPRGGVPLSPTYGIRDFPGKKEKRPALPPRSGSSSSMSSGSSGFSGGRAPVRFGVRAMEDLPRPPSPPRSPPRSPKRTPPPLHPTQQPPSPRRTSPERPPQHPVQRGEAQWSWPKDVPKLPRSPFAKRDREQERQKELNLELDDEPPRAAFSPTSVRSSTSPPKPTFQPKPVYEPSSPTRRGLPLQNASPTREPARWTRANAPTIESPSPMGGRGTRADLPRIEQGGHALVRSTEQPQQPQARNTRQQPPPQQGGTWQSQDYSRPPPQPQPQPQPLSRVAENRRSQDYVQPQPLPQNYSQPHSHPQDTRRPQNYAQPPPQQRGTQAQAQSRPPPQIPAFSLPEINVGPAIDISPPDISVSAPGITISGPEIAVSGPDISVSGPDQQQPRHVLPPPPIRGGMVCGGCGGPIVGRIVSAMDARWHPQCFKCSICHELLEHVSSYEFEGRPYCHLDYHENFAPKCYHCKTSIVDERFITLDDPALGKRTYHEQHFFCAECGDPFLAPHHPRPSHGAIENLNIAGDGEFEEDDVGFTVYKGHPYCEACHVRLRMPKCKRCKRSIRDGDRAVEALGGKWCWECFVCTGCERPFDNPSFFQRRDKPYCESCFSLILRNEL